MTHRIATFRNYDSQNWFFWVWLKELNLLKIRLTELNFFFRDSKELISFFLSMTLRIELVFEWLKELNLFFFQKKWLKELNIFFDLTQRIEPFLIYQNITQRIESVFTWLKELIFFQYDSQNWTFFFLKTTHRIEPFLFWIRRTLFLWIWPKNWTLISLIWRKELNRLIFECDAKNWTV